MRKECSGQLRFYNIKRASMLSTAMVALETGFAAMSQPNGVLCWESGSCD